MTEGNLASPSQGPGNPAPQGQDPAQAPPQPQDGGASGGSGASEARTFTQDQVKSIAATEKREGKTSAVNDLLEKTGAESIEDVIQAYTDAKAMEEELKSDAIKDVEGRYKDLLNQERANNARILKTARLERALIAQGVPDERLDDALALANLETMQVDKQGQVSGVEKTVDALLEPRPYLLSGAGQRQRVNAPQTRGTGAQTPGSGPEDPREAAGQSFFDWLTAPMEREEQSTWP